MKIDIFLVHIQAGTCPCGNFKTWVAKSWKQLGAQRKISTKNVYFDIHMSEIIKFGNYALPARLDKSDYPSLSFKFMEYAHYICKTAFLEVFFTYFSCFFSWKNWIG